MAVAARKAAVSVAARQRARELQVRFQEREQRLLEAAEEFIASQEDTGKALAGIGRQIVDLEQARGREERVGWERGARVAARMRALGAREGEVAERLGVDLGELRRMLTWARDVVQGGGKAGPSGGAQPGARPGAGGAAPAAGPVPGPVAGGVAGGVGSGGAAVPGGVRV